MSKSNTKISSIDEALEIVYKNAFTNISDLNSYCKALDYVTSNRDKLKFYVPFDIPGECGEPNNHEMWTKIKKNSEDQCGCGNSRMVGPISPRTEYEPGDLVDLVQNEKLYLRPIGGNDTSAYTSLILKKDKVLRWDEPFYDGVSGAKSLSKLLDIIISKGKLIVYTQKHMPVFEVNQIGLKDNTINIILDKDVEKYTPKNDPGSPRPGLSVIIIGR